ncbi:TetR/AcrR family transcriptional regulator [Paucibacter sp. R3-3]|uniref:TetR/AcrR family transcriptional regulator n=1 Tax=Roseateles agri TaxID=3098619 RepID=A0ABU5D9D7_9BURK|nr:TetR/AcrR family transcriptional regulator [Paucibacter sp. R3-3]MDY0742892.1 TetR/AcrR family transcriptional regulator [Paucibacter sp. R3-3]
MATKKKAPAGPAAARVRRSPDAMQRLRLRMLERARAIHRDEGLEALSMRRMAEEFGLSTMALYSYFANKNALLEGLWVEVFETLNAQLLRVDGEGGTALRRLEAHVRSFMAFWLERPDLYRLIYMSATPAAGHIDIEHQPAYERMRQLTRQRVHACLDARLAEAQRDLQVDLVALKMLGYLQLALGLARYDLQARDELHEHVVQDILKSLQDAKKPGRGRA